jgi:hypothetical protein
MFSGLFNEPFHEVLLALTSQIFTAFNRARLGCSACLDTR